MVSFRKKRKRKQNGEKTEKTEKRVGSLKFLLGKFEEIEDYRDQSKIKYDLSEILLLVFCALLSGSETYEEIADFGTSKLNWLRKFSSFENGTPSHDTIGRALSILNTKQLEKALAEFASYGIELTNGTIINIDSKWISRSATIKEQRTKKSKGGKQAVNMVNVYCSALDSCLVSIRVSSKSGEKNALEDILSLLDLSDCLITMDAGYCYTDVAKQVV
ncbi:MAG: ISAs1 family transposase [Bacteroidota bacterium]